LREYICKKNGQIETREEKDLVYLEQHPRDPWLYYVIIPEEFPKGIFVKLRLDWDEGDKDDEAFAIVANLHRQN
jgi:hypothetical protein